MRHFPTPKGPPTRVERLLATPCAMTEAEADALLAEPSPYTVDLFGLRERRAGEAVFHRVTFAEFEARAREVQVGRRAAA